MEIENQIRIMQGGEKGGAGVEFLQKLYFKIPNEKRKRQVDGKQLKDATK